MATKRVHRYDFIGGTLVPVVNLDSEADDNYTSSFPIVLLLVYRINDSNP